MTPATASARRATVETVVVVLSDASDWREPVERAARLAARTRRRLEVVLDEPDELLTAAGLDCVRLLASGGRLSAFDLDACLRLVKAQRARLQQGLAQLASRYAIDARLVEQPDAALPEGTTALALFARRRGALLVVHAGTRATLEIALSLAAERHQRLRVLSVEASSRSVDARGPLRQDDAFESLDLETPLAVMRAGKIASLIVDPAYLALRRLDLRRLLVEVRPLLRGG